METWKMSESRANEGVGIFPDFPLTFHDRSAYDSCDTLTLAGPALHLLYLHAPGRKVPVQTVQYFVLDPFILRTAMFPAQMRTSLPTIRAEQSQATYRGLEQRVRVSDIVFFCVHAILRQEWKHGNWGRFLAWRQSNRYSNEV